MASYMFEFTLQFQMVHPVWQSQWDQGLVDAGDPGVLQGV